MEKIIKFLKKYNIYILLVTAFFLSAVTFTIKRFYNTDFLNNSSKLIGKKILYGLNKSDIKKIILFKANGKRIVLDEIGKEWCVANLFNYPADEKRVDSFLEALEDARIMQTVITNKTAIDKLELNFAENSINIKNSIAADVKLYNSENKHIAELVIGKRRSEEIVSTGEKLYLGRYVMAPNEKRIVFTDNQFTSTGFSKYEWLDKTFPLIKEIKSIQLSENNNIRWNIERKEQNGNFFIDGNKNRKVENANVSRLLSVLGNLDFYSVVNPSLNRVDSGLDNPKIIIVNTFNARIYNILIGNKIEGKYYVKIDPIGDKDDSFYRKWIYLIDANRIEALLADKKDFTMDIDSPDMSKFSMPIS